MYRPLARRVARDFTLWPPASRILVKMPVEGPAASPRHGRTTISLGTKTAVPIAAALALAGAIAAVVVAGQTRRQIVDGKVTAATMIVDLMAATVAPALDFDDTQTLDEELGRLAQNRDVTCAAVWRGEDAAPAAQFRPSGSAAPGRPRQSEVSLASDTVMVTRVLEGRDGRPLGALAVGFSLRRENERIADARAKIVAFVGLLAVVLAATMIAVARRLVIAPLQKLTNAARRLELGSAEPVAIETDDELGHMARAFNAMVGAIVDRERRLATANRGLEQLLDNMRQGIVVFAEGGSLSPVKSRQTEELFHQGSLEGLRVQELLFPKPESDVAAEAFDQWVHAAFGVPIDAWDDVAPLAPSTVVLHGGTTGERVLALDFRPIEESGKIDRIMMLVSDETQVRHLERAVVERQEEHDRQMSAMRRLVAGGGQLLVSILSRARERLDASAALLDSAEGPLETALVGALFELAHSIKGEARAFDLAALDARAAELEDFLAILRGRLREGQKPAVAAVRADLQNRLVGTRDAVARASEMLVAASPIGAAVLDQTTVQRADVDRLLALTEGQRDEVGRIAVRIASRPFGEALLGLVEAAPRWAVREGKRVTIEVEGRDVLVPPALARVLPDVLTHLVRNALAHGVEPVSDRLAAGKSDVGLVRVTCSEGPDGPLIAVEDDGRGLDAGAILLEARGLDVTEGHEPARLVFEPGLSTAVPSTLAGHGVGLGAVRSDLARAGYTIELTTRPSGLRVWIAPARSDRPARTGSRIEEHSYEQKQ
jgi:two-component system chemotaxis sensor kinase CheA